MNKPRRRLRNRLMSTFAGFTLAVTALFGLYAVAFAYSVEDLFFRTMLEREADLQLAHRAATGTWARPREPFMTVVEDAASMPDGIAARLRAEPDRTEFSGRDGRHYHLQALYPPPPAARAWLLAEVSGQLVVRPQRGVLLQWLAWSGAAVIALALLLGYALARRMTAPLSRLVSVLDDAAPAQLPSGFAHRFGDDEVGVLAQALEQLIGRLDAFLAREREFTRDASHELRTPLAVIRSACERLADESALSAAGRESLRHVRASAWQLEQTVATLLSLAREERSPACEGDVVLLPLLERVIVEQSPQSEGKALDVEVDVPADARSGIPAPVLHILLSNLVGNAFAHTRAGRVRIDIDAGRLRIANPGAGVRSIDFEPHVKSEGSAGFGLGLSIVRRLCERYGLDLRFETEGATTVASLALARDLASARAET